MLVKVLAVEPCNSYKPGTEFEVTEREANKLIEKGLCVLVAPKNKAMLAPANKANPIEAAGQAPQSSVSQAAQVSQEQTVTSSPVGRRRGRPPKSSQ